MSSTSQIVLPRFVVIMCALNCFARHANAVAQVDGTQQTATRMDAGSPAEIFQQGTSALANGQLKKAEQAFLDVARLDPGSAAAYANLGVVYMREKQWNSALQALHHAQKLDPRMTGISLNIGLAYYRQNRLRDAIPAFESVLHDDRNSMQARMAARQGQDRRCGFVAPAHRAPGWSCPSYHENSFAELSVRNSACVNHGIARQSGASIIHLCEALPVRRIFLRMPWIYANPHHFLQNTSTLITLLPPGFLYYLLHRLPKSLVHESFKYH